MLPHWVGLKLNSMFGWAHWLGYCIGEATGCFLTIEQGSALGQGCRLGSVTHQYCRLIPLAYPVAWPDFLKSQDWKLLSVVGQSCKVASLCRQGSRTGSIAGIT